MQGAACRMVGASRAAGARVVVAGSESSDRPQGLREAGADAVLIGGGIAALRELARRLGQQPRIDARRWVSGIPGVASWPDGRVHVTDVGVLPPDPQLSGEAAWDLVDMDRYRRMWQRSEEHTSEIQSLMRISYDVFCLKKKLIQTEK